MESNIMVGSQKLDWTNVDPAKIESAAFRDLLSRVQQDNSDLKSQEARDIQHWTWSNWRDSHWKQRR